MFKSLSIPVWILALALAACGGDDAGITDPGGSDAGSASSGSASSHPLADLTADRLDDYIDVLKTVASDPDKSAPQVAVRKGWRVSDWVMLDMAVKSVAKDGGFDAMLDRLRGKLASVGTQLAEYERNLGTAAEAQRPAIEKAIETLKNAMSGWNKTIGQADALRAGGELVESRLAEIDGARGK